MNMQGLDSAGVITNVAANYRACHDTVIHEYSARIDIDGGGGGGGGGGLAPHFYCLIVHGEQVPSSWHADALQAARQAVP